MKPNIQLIFVSILAGFLFFILVVGFIFPSVYENTFLGEMKYKTERLLSTNQKKIVFIGGSSVAFGIKSELIKEAFPEYEIVNFGMYADLGTVPMLDWAKSNIVEGDIYLIMPEQSEQTLSCFFNGESIWQAADGALSLLPKLSPTRYEKLAASFLPFVCRKLYYTLYEGPKIHGIYSRSSFNEYGDIAYDERRYNIMPGEYNPNDLIHFSSDIVSPDFIEEMNDFATHVNNLGGMVYYHFSPINEKALAANATKAKIDLYYEFLQQNLRFPILGNPHTSIMKSGWFYDTNFHLNDSGAAMFTNDMIEDLKLLFKDTSVTTFSLPNMPIIPKNYLFGMNKDVDCFNYEEKEEGYIILSLNELGQTSTSLILPTTYKEKPIIDISKDLFIDNNSLLEVTIQPNIRLLYDGIFQGCTTLRKIILTGTPSDYSIGEELLMGTNALIYVPYELIDTYKRHYSWQKYEAFIF